MASTTAHAVPLRKVRTQAVYLRSAQASIPIHPGSAGPTTSISSEVYVKKQLNFHLPPSKTR